MSALHFLALLHCSSFVLFLFETNRLAWDFQQMASLSLPNGATTGMS